MRRSHNFIDLTGKVFGRLTVIEIARPGKYMKWRCLCACGTERVIFGAALRRGLTISCGCFNRENRYRTDNKYRTHGACTSECRTPTYQSWTAMLNRCRRTKHRDWPRYGGRGIQVCQRWRDSFSAFLEDMGERPHGMSLDRIDNDGNYEPGNCRWASPKEQVRNNSKTRFLVAHGQAMPIGDWAKASGIGGSTIRERLRRGWTLEDAVTVAPMPKGLAVLHPSRRRFLPIEEQPREVRRSILVSAFNPIPVKEDA